ncbi:helix-turn-helix domain-containing protein [Arsukibacterium sp.]|uniref:helix-turn-helix domain-containing protein n=1 Tax=Arsukibacterium sp. TaxID=1977258 RepID=UPI002FDACB5C
MQTTDFLNDLKAVYGLTSDYQLAKKLSVNTSTIGNYRSGRSYLSDEMALKVADLLEIDPLIVMACVHAERYMKQGSAEVFDFWCGVADRAIKSNAKMTLHAV